MNTVEEISHVKQGFTLVEVVSVLVVMAILGLMVVSQVGSTDNARLAARSGDVLNKLRYAHVRAVKSGAPWGVRSDATNMWLFRGADPTDVVSRQRFPGESDLQVSLAGKGMTVTAFTVIFDGYGIPYTAYTDETTNTKVDAGANAVQVGVSLPGSSANRTLSITPETGFIP